MNPAAAIRARRLELGLTQETCAESYGCPQARWAEIESGRHQPTLATLERVAKVLKCKVKDFL